MPATRWSPRRWIEPAPGLDEASTELRLFLLGLLLRPIGPWWVRGPLLALAVVGLVDRRTLSRPALWLAVTALLTARVIAAWPLPDNHSYLLAYVGLAVFLAGAASDLGPVLARAFRWLIVATFACAALWKGLLAPDYLDGRFFTVTLVTDERFAAPVHLLTGLGEAELEANRRAFDPLPAGAELAEPPVFHGPPSFRRLVRALTWGGLGLELALALAFLFPAVARWRHPLLLVFCGLTYAFAPVAGFGWVLLVLGLAQCRAEERLTRGLYVAAFVVVLLYAEVPWAELLLTWLRGA